MHLRYQPKSPQDRRAPEWARWKACDKDGTWHWFECRPRWNKRMGVWSACRGETAPIIATLISDAQRNR